MEQKGYNMDNFKQTNMGNNKELNDYFLKKQLNDIQMEYNPDEYDVRELRLVYKFCGNLYTAFVNRDKVKSYLNHAIEDCQYYWDNRNRLFKGEMPEQEYNRLKNELSLIRLELGV